MSENTSSIEPVEKKELSWKFGGNVFKSTSLKLTTNINRLFSGEQAPIDGLFTLFHDLKKTKKQFN